MIKKMFNSLAQEIVDVLIARITIPDVTFRILRLEPGDIIVLKTQYWLSDEACERLKEQAMSNFPGHRVNILEQLDLGVVRETLINQTPDPNGIKFYCPSCERLVVDQWITRIKGETRIRCPICKSGHIVSITPRQ